MNIQGTTYKEIGEQYLKIGGIPKELIQDLAEARQLLEQYREMLEFSTIERKRLIKENKELRK